MRIFETCDFVVVVVVVVVVCDALFVVVVRGIFSAVRGEIFVVRREGVFGS